MILTWNYHYSKSTGLVNAMGEERALPVFLSFLNAYPWKVCFCYLASDSKAMILSLRCDFNFGLCHIAIYCLEMKEVPVKCPMWRWHPCSQQMCIRKHKPILVRHTVVILVTYLFLVMFPKMEALTYPFLETLPKMDTFPPKNEEWKVFFSVRDIDILVGMIAW